MTDTSSPAFPRTGVSDGAVQVDPQRGMTMRQYYAGQALQGLMAARVKGTATEFAIASVITADALLSELAK